MLWSAYREQLLTALIFAGLVGAVFVAGWGVMITAVVRKLTGRRAPRRWRWTRRTIAAAAIVGMVCVAYGYFVEPYWLEVTHVSIASSKLAPGGRPIRIVHISDLHCDDKKRLEDKLPDVIAELKPDLIAFTGDGFNSPTGLVHFRECMTRLARLAPTFAVRGNLDLWFKPDNWIGGTGARELTYDPVTVTAAGQRILLVGAAAANWPVVEQALAGVPKDALTVVLYHYPDEIPSAAKLGVDLYLTGHTHGGQIALPFYGALVTLSRYGKRFEKGLYQVGPTHAYVSRGIGMEGGLVPRVRFCARPEVTVIDLRPAGQ